jgi:pilus assembly protein CpaF
MVMMAGLELPLRAIREQVASAVQLIIHIERLRDGTRRVVQVSEVQGMEADTILLQDIFVFVQTGLLNGRVMGSIRSTGLRPKFAEKFAVNNIELPAAIFTRDEEL